MTQSPRVVFLYGDRPSGHSAAAAALRDELLRRVPRARITEIALSSEVAPVVGPVISAAYLSLIQMTPRLWNYLYDNRTVASALKEIREPLSALHRMRLRKRFKQLEPDLVVCTHALACAVIETDKEQGLLNAPIAAALTDYGVHEYWVSPQVDLYLAPSDSVREELIKRGAERSRVHVTGIPVHPMFRKPLSREDARRAMHLAQDGPVVMFEGGSKGLGPIEEMMDAVLKGCPEAQALVVCGRNEELYLGLRKRFAKDPRVKTLAFTRRMPECFASADLLVGKPGGVTSSEAAACGLPQVIVEPLPGQELRNCEYLKERGAAVQVDKPADLGAAAAKLLRTPAKLASMREAARLAAPIDSAERACRLLVKLLEDRRPVGPKPV